MWPFAAKTPILLYHRVFAASSDPLSLCVTPKHFSEHLEYLCSHYKIISLGELGEALEKRRLPRGAVVVTFDDGYADNLWNARPLLERYEAPATIFMVSGYILERREFWWDDLERILLLPKNLPSTLQLNIKDKVYSWQVGDSYARHRIYQHLQNIFYTLDGSWQKKIISELVQWAGLTEEGRLDYRPLNADELKSLSSSGLIQIGSHTNWHLMLSQQPEEIERCEIIESKQNLERILGKAVPHFAYPYGTESEVGMPALNLASQAGYKLACANFPAYVTNHSRPFWLPRYLVRDWEAKEFSLRLKKIF